MTNSLLDPGLVEIGYYRRLWQWGPPDDRVLAANQTPAFLCS